MKDLKHWNTVTQPNWYFAANILRCLNPPQNTKGAPISKNKPLTLPVWETRMLLKAESDSYLEN